VACPYFMPSQPFPGGNWRHPSRLPLKEGWRGVCTASSNHPVIPGDEEIQEFCNLGYASKCPRLPAERPWDAIRISVARERENVVVLSYVCEYAHLPREHGVLEYDAASSRWVRGHTNAVIQRMAECYLESYFRTTRSSVTARPRVDAHE
jgi:hypothetical protein